MNTIKITNAQNLIVQSILSIILSSAVSAISAVAQYVLRGGHVDIGVALSIGVAAFATIFGAALRAYLPSHAREVIQAAQDTKEQALQEASTLRQQLAAQQSVQTALDELKRQQSAQSQSATQQVVQQVTDALQKAVAQQVPAQLIQAPAPQPVTVNITPATPMVASVSQPAQDTPPVQQRTTPAPPAPPDVSLVNTAAMPVTAPASVANPLADFFSGNEDTQTAVQVASARRATQ